MHKYVPFGQFVAGLVYVFAMGVSLIGFVLFLIYQTTPCALLTGFGLIACMIHHSAMAKL